MKDRDSQSAANKRFILNICIATIMVEATQAKCLFQCLPPPLKKEKKKRKESKRKRKKEKEKQNKTNKKEKREEVK